MRTRPAQLTDLADLTALQLADDRHWFGAAEHDEAEVREELEHVPDLAAQSLLVLDGEHLVGACWWWGPQTTVLAAPGPGRPAVIATLLDHLRARGVRDVPALDRDTELRDAITARGWRHAHSGFDLLRPVTDDWDLPEPAPVAGVVLGPLTGGDLPAVHSLIYDAAAWTDVPGHVGRTLEEWRSIFVTGDPPWPEHVVARRDGRPVGVVLTRTFSDGTGWIGQLAVDRAERGHGLGRSLLLAGLRNRRDAGATQLGLGVQAANAAALRLYDAVGLRIERQYLNFQGNHGTG